MAVALFLNTQYFEQKFSSDLEAAYDFSKMVLSLKLAIKQGAENYLVSTANAVDTVLAYNYCIRDWIKDRRHLNDEYVVDRDIQRYFANKLDKAPFSEDSIYQTSEVFLENEIEVNYGGESQCNPSATLAFMSSGILISPKLAIYTDAFVKCSVNSLIDNSYEARLRCINDDATCSEHFDHIRASAEIKLTKSIDMWTHREQFFPNLDFCDRVESQLTNISQWNVILERLLELQDYSRHWTSGGFDSQKIPSKASPEGEQLKNNERAVQERTFQCSDQQNRIFYWHLRATPGAIRIYFYPFEDGLNSKIIIGHIGGKPYYP